MGEFSKRIDEIGKRYGKLLVVAEAAKKEGDGNAQYSCRCDCGELCIRSGTHLRKGSIECNTCVGKTKARKMRKRRIATTHVLTNIERIEDEGGDFL